MASNYEKIMELVNAGNKMGLSNTITRDNGIPLDLSSVQADYETAVIYAATKAIAYIGQPVSVGGTLYIISDTAAEEKYIAADGTEYDNYLKEVGSVPALDELSIALNDEGAIELKGFKAAAGATLPQVKIAEDGSRTLEWVAIDAIVEGDGNTKSVVAVAADSALTVTPSYDSANDTYTYTLDVTIPDVDLSNYYTKTEVDAAIEAAAYDDSALDTRLTVVEGTTKDHETRLSKVETFFETAEGDSLDEALDTLKEIQDYIDSDKTVADIVTANAAAIEKLNGNAETEGSVAKQIADAISASETTAAETYATKIALEEYVTTETAESTYAKAANVYTKDEVYSKSETDTAIADAVKNATGGESASDVLIELNNYKKAVNRELWGAEEVADYTATTSRIDTLESDDAAQDALISSNTALAQKGVDNAATAQAAAEAAQSTADSAAAQANTNKTDIAALVTRVDGTDSNVTSLTTRLAALETEVGTVEASRIDSLEGSVTALSSTVSGHTTEITTLKDTTIPALEGEIDAVDAKFANYSTTAQMNDAIAAALNGFDQSALEEAIAANTQAIADEKTRAEAAEKANADAIAILIGETEGDDAKSVRDIAKEEVAAVVGAAPDAFNTLEEIAAWIQNDETGAAALSTKVAAHDTVLAGIGGTDEPTTVLAAIESAIANATYELPAATTEALGGVKLSDEVGVNDDGQLKITKVTTDVIAQGAEEFVLNGGNASGAVSA